MDRYVTRAVYNIETELRGTADWPLGKRDSRGRGWEKIQADAADRLGALGRADWNALTRDEARAAFVKAAPTVIWTLKRHVTVKFNSQWPRAVPAAWPDALGPARSCSAAAASRATEPRGSSPRYSVDGWA